MKKTIEERIKFNLIKIGRKNQFLRIIVIPFLFLFMFIFSFINYCKNNSKRFAMMSVVCLFFVVYCSFSFPLFKFTYENNESFDEYASEVNLAQTNNIKIEDVELIDDEELLENESAYGIHGMDEVETVDAEEIIELSNFNQDKYPNFDINKFASLQKSDISDYFSKDDWKLILVNKQHSIPEDYSFELGTIKGAMECDSRIIDDLAAMLMAAWEDGIELVIRSPYRSTERQEYLFNRKIALYMRMGMSYAESYQLSSEAVTVPGASEHQIGLALDITSADYSYLEEGFSNTEGGKWLANNSYKYGFIVRYPEGKEYLTGIEYEPWHFRYVGYEAATVIKNNNLCLEEFYEELK